jgi:predicted RNA-binding protein YlxR (DUF448 family)
MSLANNQIGPELNNEKGGRGVYVLRKNVYINMKHIKQWISSRNVCYTKITLFHLLKIWNKSKLLQELKNKMFPYGSLKWKFEFTGPNQIL